MNHTQLFECLRHCVNAKRPAFIQGPPGVGKTAGLTDFFSSIGYEVWTESAVHFDPTDVKGIPSPDPTRKFSSWLPPEFMYKLSQNGHRNICLAFQDLPTAAPMTQASLYRLMLEHRVNDEVVLPDSVYICADGNRAIDAAAAHQMPTPLRNRLVHFTLEANLDDWTKWAISADIDPMVIGFLRFKRELLYLFDKVNYAYPTPRSWSFVSDFIKQKPSAGLELELYAGCVGEGAATDFVSFLRLYRELPSIDAILLNPKKAPVPDAKDPAKLGVLYAVATGLGRAATKNNLAQVITYLDRLPPEFSVLCIRDATGRDSSLHTTREFLDWGAKHAEYLA